MNAPGSYADECCWMVVPHQRFCSLTCAIVAEASGNGSTEEKYDSSGWPSSCSMDVLTWKMRRGIDDAGINLGGVVCTQGSALHKLVARGNVRVVIPVGMH